MGEGGEEELQHIVGGGSRKGALAAVHGGAVARAEASSFYLLVLGRKTGRPREVVADGLTSISGDAKDRGAMCRRNNE